MMALRTPAVISALISSSSSACSKSIVPSIFRNQSCNNCCHYVRRNAMGVRWNSHHTKHYNSSYSTSKILDESELDDVCNTITSGAGYVVLPDIFSHQEAVDAYDVIQEAMKTNKNEDRTSSSDIRHNLYSGMMFGILEYGDIIQKFVANQIILQISNRILGENCRLSSLSSNTIYKEMGGQNPHLDYPYYRPLWPRQEGKKVLLPNIMTLTFVTALSDLIPENGSTALIPGSQLNLEHPDDIAEFKRKAIQISAKRGDLCVIAGSIQHCSMPNHTEKPRCAILQQMAALYVTPLEDFREFEKYVPTNDKVWRQLLAMDHPLPFSRYVPHVL